ncbi:MAG: hypothetical protein ABJE95_34645 [Byssovorax sp.]
MKLSHALSSLALTLTAAAAFEACSAGGGTTGTSGDATTTTGAGGGGGTTSASSATTGSGGSGGSLFDAGHGGGSQGGSAPYLIYAHTNTTLYSLDPVAANLPITQIGDFDCVLKPGEMATPGKVASMTDLAIDENLSIWSVSSFAVHPITVTGSTVHCGTPIPLTDPILMDKNKRFYSLSFAPTGVLDPAKEVLVAGNTAGELWSIDAAGKITQHGSLGNIPATDGHGHAYANYDANVPKAWEISGDIVFLSNNGKPVGFATVRDCPNPPSPTGCAKVDTLIEIDMAKMAMAGAQNVQKSLRGQVVKRAGCADNVNVAYGFLYGIATWNDKVYGFGHEGNLVDISLLDGSACLVKNYPSNMFSGAAVTTVAPVTPPPS